MLDPVCGLSMVTPPQFDPSPAEEIPPKGRRVSFNGTLAVLASLATIFGIIVVVYGLISPAPTTPEEHVAACRAEHNAQGRLEAGGRSTGDSPPSGPEPVWIYPRCTWPAYPGVESDGYYEVQMTAISIPNTSGADAYTEINILSGPCATFRVQYRLHYQGLTRENEPVEVGSGQLVDMEGIAENIGPYENLLPPAALDGVSILSHYYFLLVDVSCVEF